MLRFAATSLPLQGTNVSSGGGAAEAVEEQMDYVQLTNGQGQPVTYTADQLKTLTRDEVWLAAI